MTARSTTARSPATRLPGGGGAFGGTLYNCIVYYNDAARGANYDNSTFNYSCTTPHPGGSGNITSEPQLASFSHLAVGSPCRGAGHSDYATGADIDGEAWRAPPSMGCDEVAAGAITGALSVSAWVAPTNVAVGFPIRFRADILGRTTGSVWDFGDGTALSNNPYALHAYASPGVYSVLLRAYNESYPQGITATVTVQVAAQTIHYVKLGNATPIAPYISWETAATNIQDALDAASQIGALVLVSNGIYAAGGRVVYGALANRVAITKPVTVRSVNGPAMTIIQGAGLVGDSAVRCAYVGTNAVLEGFTLTNGATRSSGDYREQSGGGVWCESSGVLNNCVLTGNSASYGGGTYYGTLYNCIVYYNDATRSANYDNSTFNYSCTTPYPGGSGNITSEPQLASFSHLAVGSPCRGAGHSDYAMGTDIDGEAWRAPPSMGCDEVAAGAITGALSVSAWAAPTNVAVGFPIRFRADILGRTTGSVWDFGDGTALSNNPYALHAYASPGVYSVLLRAYNESYPQGITATVMVQVAAQTIHYVKLGNATPIAPYISWETAATNIQDALDAASQVGALVLVSNGIYATGGRVVYGALSNRVAITKPVTVRSVNGSAMTIIQGAGPMGDNAVRCAHVGTNAVLSGFTLTKGATRSSGDSDRERDGGGVWCESSGVLSNCVLIGNSAYSGGGGAHYGTLYNCTLTGNSASYGGGAFGGTLYNCVLTGNSASYGGGAYGGALYNCIVYYNDAARGANYYNSAFNYSCTTPHPGGSGNITSEPQLASFSHLAVGSPCRGAGHSDYATGTDIDGEAWRAPPSMGCDEVAAGAITGALSVSTWAAPTNVAVGFPIRFQAEILGRTTGSVWDFGDGTALSNKPYALHAYASPGVYSVLLRAYNESYPQGITATVTVRVAAQAIHYVKLGNTTPIAPYSSWETAANNIQDALDAASQVGALVLVSNGIYATGGRVVYGELANRVAITKPVTVRSVNGPAMTIIQGAGPTGDSAVRCAYVGTNAVLAGFTLTNGATRSSGDLIVNGSGGGVWCESSGVLSNCVLTGNSAIASRRRGVWRRTLQLYAHRQLGFRRRRRGVGGTLYNCTLSGNVSLLRRWRGGGEHALAAAKPTSPSSGRRGA